MAVDALDERVVLDTLVPDQIEIALAAAGQSAFTVSLIAAESSLYDQRGTPKGETVFSWPQPLPPCPPA